MLIDVESGLMKKVNWEIGLIAKENELMIKVEW